MCLYKILHPCIILLQLPIELIHFFFTVSRLDYNNNKLTRAASILNSLFFVVMVTECKRGENWDQESLYRRSDDSGESKSSTISCKEYISSV